jgi:glycosyltransferase involved in cell wall biosynthesis
MRLIRKWKPDLIQTCLPRMDVVGGITATRMRVPFVIREPNTRDSYPSTLRARLRVLVGRRAAAVIANSDGGAAYWAAVAPSIPTHVIPNAVPVEAIEAATPTERPGNAALLVYVGRLVREKNVDIVLRAAARVMAERELVVDLCGDGPRRAELEALAADHRIAERVRFNGFVHDAWSHLRAADITVLVSDFEGSPNVVHEAFAAGAPMILSDIPVHRELAGDGEVLFVPCRDVDATAAAIRNTLDDRDATQQRIDKARRLARAWTIADMVSAYENVGAGLTPRR